MPLHLHDIGSTWPTVQVESLDEKTRKRFERLVGAFQLYLSGGAATEAIALGGVCARQFYRLLDRCMELNQDGRINGMRALVGSKSLKKRLRTAPLKPSQNAKSGYAGAFGMLLRQYPALETVLVDTLLRRRRKGLQPNTVNHRYLHGVFMKACTECGIAPDAYPFNTKSIAKASLMKWVRTDFGAKHANALVKTQFGNCAANLYAFGQGDGTASRKSPPYSDWSVDAYKVDVIAKLRLLNLWGDVDEIELRRFIVIAVIDAGSGAWLAARVVFNPEASAEDVILALYDALRGGADPEPGQHMESLLEGAGFPASVLEPLLYALPAIIRLDNAVAHLADKVQHVTQGILHATVVLGSPASPHGRPSVESEFARLATRLCQQLPASTGKGPKDPVREISHVPLKQRVTALQLKAAIDAYARNRNVTPVAASGYRSPLENLRLQLDAGTLVPRHVPPHHRRAEFFSIPVMATVKMEMKAGRSPHVNFMYCRYGGDMIARRFDLVGKHVYVRANYENLRTVLLFDEHGAEIGPVAALGRWGAFPHDVRVRKMFGKLKREGELGLSPEEQPLEALFSYLRSKRDATSGLKLQYVVDYLRRHDKEGSTALLMELVRGDVQAQLAADALALVPLAEACPAPSPPDRQRVRLPVLAAQVSSRLVVSTNVPKKVIF